MTTGEYLPRRILGDLIQIGVVTKVLKAEILQGKTNEEVITRKSSVIMYMIFVIHLSMIAKIII